MLFNDVVRKVVWSISLVIYSVMERFDKVELDLIEQFLLGRIIALREIELSTGEYRQLYPPQADSFSMSVNVDLLQKIKSEDHNPYSAVEISIINSCVMRNLDYLTSKMPHYPMSRWYEGTRTERELMHTINTCKSILSKTGLEPVYENAAQY